MHSELIAEEIKIQDVMLKEKPVKRGYPYQLRVLDEEQDLENKILKLSALIRNTEVFQGLPVTERNLLSTQLCIMRKYSKIFKERIKLFGTIKVMNVCLGGTCNDSTWREEVIAGLEVEYFNPLVSDWTPECQVEEVKQREECDICLYVITPKMTGTYGIAEAVDDSNKRPGRVVFVGLREDGEQRFDEKQWGSIGAVAELIKGNGGMTFSYLSNAINYINGFGKR